MIRHRHSSQKAPLKAGQEYFSGKPSKGARNRSSYRCASQAASPVTSQALWRG